MLRNLSSLLALSMIGAAAFAAQALAQDTVTAVKADKPPNLAAGASDPAWTTAQALSIPLLGGTNFKDGKTTATIKALHAGDMLYMLVQYDDPTESVRRSPFQKQADGSWKKLNDDNSKFYEDKLALIWNIGGSIKGFSQQGCMITCHVGEVPKPFGNKYLANEGERSATSGT